MAITPKRLILPPFAKSIDKFSRRDEIIICTGSEAWQRAKSPTWFCNVAKLVLPMDEPPERYKWPVSGRYVMVFGFGELDTYHRLIELSKCLLKRGAIWALWLIPGHRMTKIERRSREAA